MPRRTASGPPLGGAARAGPAVPTAVAANAPGGGVRARSCRLADRAGPV